MTVLVIDTSILLHKTFEKSSGYPSPEFLFFNKVNFLQDLYNPCKVIFTFDHKTPTWRHIKYPPYKGQRLPKTPEFINYKIFIEEQIKKRKYGFAIKEGFESDDLIASSIDWFPDQEIKIFTADTDMYQLVSDRVLIVKTSKEGVERVDKKYVEQAKGVLPSQIVDLKALEGDKSDNLVVPIRGFGTKKVVELLNSFENLERIFYVLEEGFSFPFPKFKEDLIKYKDLIYLFRELITLKRDIPKEGVLYNV